MLRGTLFFDPHFRFHDGENGEKILIVVGSVQGVTLVVKTTSKGWRYRNDFGCQADHRFQNFFLTKGSCCLRESTWVPIDEFYEFKHGELLQRHFAGQIFRFGTLSVELTISLLKCVLESEDISSFQTDTVQIALGKFSLPYVETRSKKV